MRILTVRLGLERGDTSMDDTIEVSVNFEVPEDKIVHAHNVVATFEDSDGLDDWFDVIKLAREFHVDRISVVTNDSLYGSYNGSAPDRCYTDDEIFDILEIRDGNYTIDQLQQWRSNNGFVSLDGT